MCKIHASNSINKGNLPYMKDFKKGFKLLFVSIDFPAIIYQVGQFLFFSL